jgi:hypothetical protein
MEPNSENNFQPGSGHSGRHSSDHSHRRHHRHSSGRHGSSSRPYRYSKRPRLEDVPKREKEKKIESFFAKNILTIFGIIFIGGAIWFAIGTWKSMQDSAGLSIEKSKTAEYSLAGKMNSFTSSIFEPITLNSARNIIDSTIILILICSLVFILTTLAVSIRKKNILLKTMSFLTWLLVACWLVINFFRTAGSLQYYGIITLSTVFFGLFFFNGFVDTYIGKSRWKFRTEYFLILLNSLFYFFTIIAVLHKSGHGNYEPVFIFLLASLHLIAFYFTDKRNLNYNKVPYLISALIITCAFLPMILRTDPVIIFLAPLSVFLILFSRYSRNQTSVLFSLFAIMTMVLIYVYQWIFELIPGILSREGIPDYTVFSHGFISGLFILSALTINNIYLRKLAISFTPRWLRKIRYLKILKGILLSVIYLFFYWIFNYLVQMIFKDGRFNLMIWFAFNCLYFIFYIPILARQQSSYFRLIIIISLISGLASFTFVHYNVLHLRNLYLESAGVTIFPFLFHYVSLAMFIGMLFTLLRYFKRAFPGKKILIKGFWVYFYLMCTFLLLSEFDHVAVLFGYHNGDLLETTAVSTRKLPYSLLLLLSSVIVITVGFVVKSRFLRLFSLFILGSALIKILVYDVGSLGQGAKMILFFILGVALLGISVSYPKIKKSFFEKDSPQSHGNFSGVRKHRSPINPKP